MKAAKKSGIEFRNPNITIDWGIREEDLISRLMCEKSESRFYMFEAKLSPSNIDVLSRITFFDQGFKMEVIVSQTRQNREDNMKTLYIDTFHMNVLEEYVKEMFGAPRFMSRVYSAINKPFYFHKWRFEQFKLTHKYQDSVIGFYECLIFHVKY